MGAKINIIMPGRAYESRLASQRVLYKDGLIR